MFASRPRACAGMQGLGVLAIAADDASCEICSVPGARAPTPPPKPKPLGASSLVFGPSPFFGTAIQPLRPPSPSLGPRGVPKNLLSLELPSSPYAPPTLSCNQGPWFTALSTRPAPVGTPPPHRASFKKHHFSSFLYTCKLRNLLRPWGPCPYHLPPRNQSPWTPPPEPLYPHPPHRVSFFFLFLIFETATLFGTAIQPLRPPQPSPATKAPWFTSTRPALVGTPPPHRASFKKHHFHPPEPQPLDPPSRALVPPHIPQGILLFLLFCTVRKLRNLLCASRGTEIGAEAAHIRAPLLKAGRCPSRIPRCIAWHGYTIS